MVLSILSSCSSTRKLAPEQNLLNKSEIVIDGKDVDVNDLKRYERQSPNKTILGVKFHLFLYNLSNLEKEKFPHSWLRKIGEAPVVFDPREYESSIGKFERYLNNKGFDEAQIMDSVVIEKKKANTLTHIILNKPIRMNSLSYEFEDRSIAAYILADTNNSLLKVGERFDKDMLQEERKRIEDVLKEQGFFKFSKEYIHFLVYNSDEAKSVDVIMNVKQSLSGDIDPTYKSRQHHRYRINEVFIQPEMGGLDDKRVYDTLFVNDASILKWGKLKIKPNTLTSVNHCIPGSMFSTEDLERTYRNYTDLGLYRIVNISFSDPIDQRSDSLGIKGLDCKIDLSPRKKQAYNFEIVGTNSAGDLGIRGNITYNNYNLFRGAEHFQLQLTGAMESMEKRSQDFDRMQEIGVESRFIIPKFLLPFSSKEFVRKFNPKTTMSVSYNYQDRPDYVRTIANANFGYTWKGNSFNKHAIFPIEFNYVRLPKMDSAFFSSIENTPLASSFKDHSILGIRYMFEYSNQFVEKRRNFVYLKVNMESAGLLLGAIKKSGGSGNDSTLLGSEYFQYVKADLDFRHYNIITPANKIVYRFFAGVGKPYGNSAVMPFEKMYFGGGPYGIRAWSTRTLGPGSYFDPENTSAYSNNLGDIKLEANLEYRFKLFWKLEGALFVDVGNVWLIRRYAERPGADFQWDRFYKDLAVGTGLGFRFDFSFFLIRTDFGLKLRDPAWQGDNKWILNDSNYPWRDKWQFQFGIGYPF